MKRSILTAEQAMFSRQRRYMSEKSIITEIDKARATQRSMREMAERLKEAARGNDVVLQDIDIQKMEEMSEKHGYGPTQYKQVSDYLFDKAERMEDGRIKELGRKLSAFRTGLLESITTDPAVV